MISPPLRFLIGGLLCLLLVPLVLIVALHVPAIQEALLQGALRKLETSAGLQIELASARWSPWRELRLFDLKVEASGEKVLECGEASLAYHLSWRWPYFHPAAIVLERPSLHLERDTEGHFRLPGRQELPSEPSRPGKPFPWAGFPWPEVRIVSGTLVASQNGQVVLSIGDVNATLSVQEMLESEGRRLKLDFGQWHGEVQTPPWGRWQFGGTAEIRNEVLSFSGVALTIPGIVQLVGEGQWHLVPPYDGMFTLRVGELSAAAFAPFQKELSQLKGLSGALRVQHQSGNWSLDHDLKTNLGSLQGTLRVAPPAAAEGQVIRLTSRFADLQVPLAAQGSESHLFGQVDLTLKGTNLEAAHADLHALLEASRWGDQTIHSGELRASYAAGVLDLMPSRMSGSLGTFELSATADLRGLWDLRHPGAVKAELRVEEASLDKVFAGAAPRVGGRIGYHGRYEAGDFRKWEQWQGNLEANLVLPQFLTLKAAGEQKGGLVNLDYDLEVADLQKFGAFFPAAQAKGKLTSRGIIKGKYPDLLWDGTLSSPAFRIGPVQGEQFSLKGKGTLLGKEAQRALTLKVQNLNFQDRRLGTVNLDLQQEADTCRFSLKSDGLETQGSARLNGKLEKLWDPVRTLLVNQSTLSWGKESASLEGRFDVSKEGIRVPSLALQHGGERVRLAGEVLFGAGSDLKLTLEGINLGQWSRALSFEVPIAGLMSGEVTVKGRTDQPEAALNLQLAQGAIVIPSKTDAAGTASRKAETTGRQQVIDRLQVQGSLVRGVLSLQGNLQSPTTQAPLAFTAKVPMHLSLYPPQVTMDAGGEVAAATKVTALQAERILPYLDFLDRLGGRLDVDVQVAGTLKQPKVTGNGSWQNGSFRVTKWPHPIENIQVDWQADAREIIVQNSSMNLLGGKVQVTGRVGYPRFFDMDFEADGTDLAVKDVYGTKGKVSGHARLLQNATTTRLTGVLHLSHGEMNLGELESDLARTISVVDGTGKEEIIQVHKDRTERNSFADRLEMDLTIVLPPSGTWVRGKGLEAEITGTLKIEKQPFARVKLRGGFQTLRGEYRLQEYKLTIVDGELIFPEGHEPDPQLKIVCQKELRDAIIQVHVTGPLKQPRLIMSSIPSMNQVDILSYLVFDRPAGDLSSKESYQLQDKAASWMGSQTSALLKRVLGDTLLTPDTIEYRKSSSASRVSSSSGNRNDPTVVAIGKRITPDLYINFQKDVTGEEGDQVAVEYRIDRHFSVQTEFGGTGQSGIDVFWRYDFGK